MKDAERYREYAADCLRMAKKAPETDKQAFLKMAEAWELRAEAAERSRPDDFQSSNDCAFGTA